MAKKMDFSKYGPWAFYLALILAAVLVFVPEAPWVLWVLGVLGLIVGLLNVAKKETTPFLIASLAWMVAGAALLNVLSGIPLVDPYIIGFLGNVITFVGPAAAVVSIMALYYITRD